MSKELYREEILTLWGENNSKSGITKFLIKKYELTDKFDKVRKWVRTAIGESSAPKNEVVLQQSTKPNISKTEFQDKIELNGKRVKSLADLIEACDINVAIWEVERYVANKWEVGTSVDGVIITEPLYQIKAFLKRKSAKNIDPAEIAKELKESISDLIKWQDHYPQEKSTGNLFVPNIFDLHLGKLAWGEESGEDYDIKIAKNRFNIAMDDLITKASGYDIGRVLFPIGNDLFNSDKAYPFAATTAGTPQQDDSRWQKLFREGRELMITNILKLAQIAPVDVVMVYSNHDRERGFYLGEVLQAVFENHPSITINNNPKNNKYYQFGKNLIATAHGDNIKPAEAPLIMAQEAPEMWADTWYREWLLGHLHHKQSYTTQTAKDYRGVIVTYLTSPSAADAWHSLKNYTGSIKGAEGFIYGKNEGKIGTVIHNIK